MVSRLNVSASRLMNSIAAPVCSSACRPTNTPPLTTTAQAQLPVARRTRVSRNPRKTSSSHHATIAISASKAGGLIRGTISFSLRVFSCICSANPGKTSCTTTAPASMSRDSAAITSTPRPALEASCRDATPSAASDSPRARLMMKTAAVSSTVRVAIAGRITARTSSGSGALSPPVDRFGKPAFPATRK